MGLIATQLYHQNSSRLAFGCQSICGISTANALCFCYFRLSLCSPTNILLVSFICCSFEKRAESLSLHLLDSSACPRHFLKHQHVTACYNNFELLLEMLSSTVQINWTEVFQINWTILDTAWKQDNSSAVDIDTRPSARSQVRWVFVEPTVVSKANAANSSIVYDRLCHCLHRKSRFTPEILDTYIINHNQTTLFLPQMKLAVSFQVMIRFCILRR